MPNFRSTTRQIGICVTMMLCAFCFQESACAQPVVEGLIHHWAADGTAEDAVGSADGTMHGNVAYGTGIFGEAFAFDGGHITFGAKAANFGTSSFTICFWVKTEMAAVTAFVSKREVCGGPPMIDARKNANGNITLELAGINGNYSIISNVGDIDDGLWHHIAWRRENASHQAYLDGCLIGQASSQTVADFASNAQLTMGRSPCTGVDQTQPFVGSLDEIQIYDRALSFEEIRFLATKPPCPADITHECQIDVDDLLMVINNWAATGDNPADVTGNGVVDVDDLLTVINAWGDCA